MVHPAPAGRLLGGEGHGAPEPAVLVLDDEEVQLGRRVLLVLLVAGIPVVAGSHVQQVLEGHALPAVLGGLRQVVPEWKPGDVLAVQLGQPHQRHRGEGGFGGRVGRQADLLRVRIVAVTGANGAGVVDAAEGYAVRGQVLVVHAGAERLRVDLGSRVVAPDFVDRAHRYSGRNLRGVGVGDRLGVRRLAGHEACGAGVPEVELEVLAGFLSHLEGGRRGGAAVEEEGHDAVVGAVLVALDQGDRQRGTAPAAVAAFAPDAPGANDRVPVGVAGEAEPAVGRDQVRAALREDDVEPRDAAQGEDERRLERPRVEVMVNGQRRRTAAEELQRSPHLVARRRGVLRQREGRVVDRRRQLAGLQLSGRQQGPSHLARPGQGVARHVRGGCRHCRGHHEGEQERARGSGHGG